MNGQIFISYSKKDRDFGHKLADDLKAAGFKIWIDRSLQVGESWEEEIESQIRVANEVIVVLSPNAVSSKWVQHEGSIAYGLDKQMYPVLIEEIESEDHPLWAKKYQYHSFVGKEYQTAFEELKNALTPPNPTQELLEQELAKYRQTQDLMSENTLGLILERYDTLVVSDEAQELITKSRQAIAERQQLEQQLVEDREAARQRELEAQTQGARRLRLYLITALALAIAAVFFAFQSRQQEKLARSGEVIAYSQAIRESNPQLSLLLAMEAVELSKSFLEVATAASEDNFLEALADFRGGISTVVLRGHNSKVTDVAFSPKGNLVVTAGHDNIARLWDISSREIIATPIALQGHTEPIIVIAISDDGHWLATGSADNTVRLWDLTAQNPADTSTLLKGHAWDILNLAFSPDNRWLITASRSIYVWDLTKKDPGENPIMLPHMYTFEVLEIAVSPDSHWLLTSCAGNPGVYASHDCPFHLWDLTSIGGEPYSFDDEEISNYAVAFSPDNQWLLTANHLRPLSGFGLAPIVLAGHSKGAVQAVFSNNSQWLAAVQLYVFRQTKARLWDVNNPESMPIELFGHKKEIRDITITPDDHWVITVSADKTIRLWDLTAPDPSTSQIVLNGHTGPINAVAISPDSQYILTGSDDHSARLQSLLPGELVAPWELACSAVGRNLTYAEWEQYLGNQEYQKTCEQWSLEIVPKASPWTKFRIDILSEFFATCEAGGCESLINCFWILVALPFVVLYYWIKGKRR